MSRRVLGVLALVLAPAASAVAQAPESDIYLAPLRRIRDSLVVGAPVNVTHRTGYDNQPGFLPDSRGILYTSVSADGQADLWRTTLVSVAPYASRRRVRANTPPRSCRARGA